MHDLPSNIYEMGSCSESYNFLQEVLLTSKDHHSNIDTISMAEAKAVAANKSHSEAERRRRKRINGHLATLRNLVPRTIKADKASLLAEVVRCIRDLKKTTEDQVSAEECNSSEKLLFPGETDELKICCEEGMVKASLCCEDRPQMLTELSKALNAAPAKVVRAETATVAGRTRTVVWVKLCGVDEETVAMGTVRKAIKVALERCVSTSGQGLPGNKRPRLYQV